jgi:hypothetical protein
LFKFYEIRAEDGLDNVSRDPCPKRIDEGLQDIDFVNLDARDVGRALHSNGGREL